MLLQRVFEEILVHWQGAGFISARIFSTCSTAAAIPTRLYRNRPSGVRLVEYHCQHEQHKHGRQWQTLNRQLQESFLDLDR
jgi:hypothetical protein